MFFLEKKAEIRYKGYMSIVEMYGDGRLRAEGRAEHEA